MKIVYKMGDLLTASEQVIVHGCNARGVMGSGVAKLIRAKYPQAYDAYYRMFITNGLELGQCIWADCGHHWVVNAITQENYGPGDQLYASYDGIEKAIRKIDATCWMTQSVASARAVMGEFTTVAFPLIGAGLAGGSWKRISEIIETNAKQFLPVVYLLDGKIPEL